MPTLRKSRRRIRIGRFALLSFLVLLFVAGCSGTQEQHAGEAETAPPSAVQPSPVTLPGTPEDQPLPNTEPESEAEPTPSVPPPAEATLIAVGDVMMHTPQLPGYYDAKTKTYNFEGFFTQVAPIISKGDWAIANLETPIAGAERGYHGYPLFNAPNELADALKHAGFNVVTTANNHSLDQGANGLFDTLKAVRSSGLSPIGTFDSAESAEQPLIIEKNGIVNAILSYTYGTNGIPIPNDKPYIVSLINKERIRQQIERARKEGADLVTVALHFGIEYQRQPNDVQRELAEYCIQAGADLILGSHPHVVQPYERMKVKGIDGAERSGVVIYSLGNFISNQFGGYKEYGVIFKAGIKKTYLGDGGSSTEIVAIDTIPTWVHKYRSKGKSLYRVLPVEAVAAAKEDPLLPARMFQILERRAAEMNAHLQSLITPALADNNQ